MYTHERMCVRMCARVHTHQKLALVSLFAQPRPDTKHCASSAIAFTSPPSASSTQYSAPLFCFRFFFRRPSSLRRCLAFSACHSHVVCAFACMGAVRMGMHESVRARKRGAAASKRTHACVHACVQADTACGRMAHACTPDASASSVAILLGV